MPELQTFHGHLVDLRRHVNVHWRHLHLIAPTDRYELWMRMQDGTERKFTVHTREMPARRGHEVSLITTPHRRPRVLALANWTTIDGVNYARSEPPGLVRVGDMLWLVAGFVGIAAWLGTRGWCFSCPWRRWCLRPWPPCGGLLVGGWRGGWTGRSISRRGRQRRGRWLCTETVPVARSSKALRELRGPWGVTRLGQPPLLPTICSVRVCRCHPRLRNGMRLSHPRGLQPGSKVRVLR